LEIQGQQDPVSKKKKKKSVRDCTESNSKNPEYLNNTLNLSKRKSQGKLGITSN
jgi:hypothetical protein